MYSEYKTDIYLQEQQVNNVIIYNEFILLPSWYSYTTATVLTLLDLVVIPLNRIPGQTHADCEYNIYIYIYIYYLWGSPNLNHLYDDGFMDVINITLIVTQSKNWLNPQTSYTALTSWSNRYDYKVQKVISVLKLESIIFESIPNKVYFTRYQAHYHSAIKNACENGTPSMQKPHLATVISNW